jgi:hypothetical protein
MDNIVPKVENINTPTLFPKHRGGGLNFYLGPPFEIFSRKIYREGATPYLHPSLAKPC